MVTTSLISHGIVFLCLTKILRSLVAWGTNKLLRFSEDKIFSARDQSLRVNIIVCLLQKTADVTYAVVEQGNSMPRTAPKKPLRTYETEYVITMIYKPYFCVSVADPVYGLQFPPLPFSFGISPKLRTHIACCTTGYWYCTLHFTLRAGEWEPSKTDTNCWLALK